MTNTAIATIDTGSNVVSFDDKGAMVVTSFREEIATEIRTHLDNIGNAYLNVGKALNEARDDFEKMQDYLDWVASEFGLQKAQTYKLMKVGKLFGDDTRFSGVAMRVLSVLAAHVDDNAVMERAADAAKAGKLDSTALTLILAPAKPAPVNPPKPTPGKVEPENSATPTASTSTPEQSVPEYAEPGDVVIDGEFVEATPAAPVPVKINPVDTATNERERALLSQLDVLKKIIDQLQADNRKRDTERDTKVKAAPMLPQFKSKCLYARLGLSMEEAQDAKKVKKAQRDLVKLGYNADHAAWDAISEAVTALTTAE